jgi:hypothetical protein
MSRRILCADPYSALWMPRLCQHRYLDAKPEPGGCDLLTASPLMVALMQTATTACVAWSTGALAMSIAAGCCFHAGVDADGSSYPRCRALLNVLLRGSY